MRVIVTEELSREDKAKIKDMIRASLLQLFYTLYIKKNFWS